MLHEFLVNEFDKLGKKGYVVIITCVPNPSVIADEVVEKIKLRPTSDRETLKLLQNYAAGQWEIAWKVRIATIDTWARLFNTRNLISSWDGFTFVSRQSQIDLSDELNEYGEPEWIHRDQSLNNSNLADTIQGYLSLSDGCEKSYSTIFYTPKKGHAQDFINEFHLRFYKKRNRYGRVISNTCDETNYYEFNS